jgi:23S rRNA (pseudouridine1915-N3)-methyltransferase
MLHIHIITLGKLKESYWREAEAEYLKRLSAFAKVTLRELKEESFKENDPSEMIKKIEAEKITTELAKIKDSYTIVLDETGKQLSSRAFSEHLSEVTMRQSNTITLIIGGPLGLDESIRALGRATLSFSKMTFTHQMIRIILLEQLYRAMMIAQNRNYHY